MAPRRNREPKRHPWITGFALVVLLILAAAVYGAIRSNSHSTNEAYPGGQPAGTKAPQQTEKPESAKPLQNRESGGVKKGGTSE